MNSLSFSSPLAFGGNSKNLNGLNSTQYLIDVKNILKAQLAVRFKSLYMPSLFGHYTVNSTCNLRCSYCYVHQPEIFPDGFSQSGLPLERAKRVLKALRKECMFLRIQGGEPLLYKDIVGLTRYAKRDLKYWLVSIITNGLAIVRKPQEYEELFEYLDLITISIDQTRMDEYPVQMSKLLEFFPELLNLSRKHKVVLTCNYTATWEELAHPEQIEETIEKYRSYFSTFYIMPVRVAGKTPLPLMKNSLKLNRKYYSLGYYTGLEYPEKENVKWYKDHCDPKLKIKIDAKGGLIYPCENHSTSIGSIEDHTIKELWTRQPIKYPNESCTGCGKQRFRSYAFKHPGNRFVVIKNLKNSVN